jgi:hypothetical protein
MLRRAIRESGVKRRIVGLETEIPYVLHFDLKTGVGPPTSLLVISQRRLLSCAES